MWQEPKTDWKSNNIPTKDDFNRIEENTKDLKENKLDIDGGEGKDITVTFTEASTESDITSGEKLSIMFGKILKKFKNIINGTTSVGKASVCTGNAATATKLQTARQINGVNFDGAANITVADGTKAPIAHASTGTGYGVGNASNYGHVRVRNDLVGTETEGATVSPAQIKKMNDKLPVLIKTQTIPLSKTSVAQHVVDLTGDFSGYDEIMLKTTGNITSFNGSSSSTIGISLYALNQAGGTWFGLLRLLNIYVGTQMVLSNIPIEGISVIKRAERSIKDSISELRWASINGFGGEFILPVQVVLSNFNLSTINSLSGSLVVEIYGLKYS